MFAERKNKQHSNLSAFLIFFLLPQRSLKQSPTHASSPGQCPLQSLRHVSTLWNWDQRPEGLEAEGMYSPWSRWGNQSLAGRKDLHKAEPRASWAEPRVWSRAVWRGSPWHLPLPGSLLLLSLSEHCPHAGGQTSHLPPSWVDAHRRPESCDQPNMHSDQNVLGKPFMSYKPEITT